MISIHVPKAAASTAESIRFTDRVTATRFRTRCFAVAVQAKKLGATYRFTSRPRARESIASSRLRSAIAPTHVEYAAAICLCTILATHRVRITRYFFDCDTTVTHVVKAPAASWFTARFNARVSISRSRFACLLASIHDSHAIASDRFRSFFMPLARSDRILFVSRSHSAHLSKTALIAWLRNFRATFSWIRVRRAASAAAASSAEVWSAFAVMQTSTHVPNAEATSALVIRMAACRSSCRRRFAEATAPAQPWSAATMQMLRIFCAHFRILPRISSSSSM